MQADGDEHEFDEDDNESESRESLPIQSSPYIAQNEINETQSEMQSLNTATEIDESPELTDPVNTNDGKY